MGVHFDKTGARGEIRAVEIQMADAVKGQAKPQLCQALQVDPRLQIVGIDDRLAKLENCCF